VLPHLRKPRVSKQRKIVVVNRDCASDLGIRQHDPMASDWLLHGLISLAALNLQTKSFYINLLNRNTKLS
jgi:hypothetical protein